MAQGWATPQAQAMPTVQFAGFGVRLVAYIIDAVILSVLAGVLFVVDVAITVAVPILGLLGMLAIIVLALAWLPYWWVQGATPGKKMMGLRVVRDADGGQLSWTQAILRLIGYMISGWIVYLGFIWIAIDQRHRGWHDLIAKTAVIKVQ